MRNRIPKKISTTLKSPDDLVDAMKNAREKLEKAETLRLKGMLDKAEKICFSVLRDHPKYYGAAHTMGLIYADKHDHEKAAQYLNRAAILHPKSWKTLVALAVEYTLVSAHVLAMNAAHDALKLEPDKTEVHTTLAEVFLAIKDYENARDHFQLAKELDAKFFEAGQGYIRASLELGEYQNAANECQRLYKIHPLSLNLAFLCYRVPSEFIASNILEAVELFILSGKRKPDESEINWTFLLCSVLEKRKQYKASWVEARKANLLKLTGNETMSALELKDIKIRVDWLKKNVTSINKKPCIKNEAPNTLFIFGPSRSGKTSLESLLGQHPDLKRGYENQIVNTAIITGYHEAGLIPVKTLSYLPVQFQSIVTDLYLQYLNELIEKFSTFTITTPGFIWDAPFFHLAIPNTHYVFVKRNKSDLMWKIFSRNYRSGNLYSFDLKTLNEYIDLYYDIIDLMQQMLPNTTMVVHYDEIIHSPQKTCDRVFDFCGLSDHKLHKNKLNGDIGCSDPYKVFMQELIDQ
ncbi:sulfotransferase [Amylibacter sp.]|nr:sulfotransferase [Amylibacter sp.]